MFRTVGTVPGVPGASVVAIPVTGPDPVTAPVNVAWTVVSVEPVIWPAALYVMTGIRVFVPTVPGVTTAANVVGTSEAGPLPVTAPVSVTAPVALVSVSDCTDHSLVLSTNVTRPAAKALVSVSDPPPRIVVPLGATTTSGLVGEHEPSTSAQAYESPKLGP